MRLKIELGYVKLSKCNKEKMIAYFKWC